MGRKEGCRSLWRMALLAASIFSSCFLLIEGQAPVTQIQIQVQPERPIEGHDVTLTPKGNLSGARSCRWFRGQTFDPKNQILMYYFPPNPEELPGPAFTNRETIGPGCSLQIRNLTSGDTRNYTVNVEGTGINAVGNASVIVTVTLLKPTVSVFPSAFLSEFADFVQLTCKTNSRDANVSWLWNGEPLNNSSRIQLSDDNWNLSINNIERSDAGKYQCQVSNLASEETSDITNIDVVYGPDMPVIQPDTPFYDVHSDIKLKCAAGSFPAANYSWFFNEEKLVSRYMMLILKNVTRENSGNYTCQAENVLNHRIMNATLAIVVLGDVYDVTIVGPPTAIENKPVSLNCTCIGTNVSYSWFKGDQLMQPGENVVLENNNQTLTFNLSTRNDTANYTCYASNTLSSNSSEPYSLEISYGPDAPIINPQETVYSMGSNLSLSCFAISNPPANYSWYRNGKWLEHENTSQLLIWDLSWLNEGIYTCNATNDVTGHNSDASQKISLRKPVTNVTISGTEKAIEHGVTVLNCSSEGTNVSYYWLKENQSLVIPGIPENIFLINNNQTLIFNPTMREDSGNYTCYGYNSLSEVSANYTLNVSYGPDVPIIKPHDTPKYLAEGTAYNLSCEAVSNPSAQYTWFINTSVEIGNQSQLLLSDLNINNTGSYSCKAFNSETNYSRFSLMPVEIYVQKILSDPILESTANGMVEENTNVTLNCRTSNSTDVRVFWFKDGHSLSPAAGLLDNNRTLVLVHVTKTDTGSYRCNASNNVSQPKSNLVNINVTYGPDEIKLNPEGTIEKTLNSDLKLECTGDSYPPAEFQWLFNNITQDVTGNILRVRLSNWTYEGNYSCKATNPFTNRTALRTTYVKLTEGPNGDDPGLSSGVIAGIVIGCLVGVVLVSGLLYYICAKTSLGRMEQHASNGNIPSAPGHNEGVTDTKPKAAEEDIQYSILAFKGNKGSPPPQPTLEASQPSDGMTIYSEIKKK